MGLDTVTTSSVQEAPSCRGGITCDRALLYPCGKTPREEGQKTSHSSQQSHLVCWLIPKRQFGLL